MRPDATLNVGVIGLGVMGLRMLDRMAAHPRLSAAVAWDADPAAMAGASGRYPGLRMASDAQAVIAHAGLHSLYVATPPAAHMALSHAAFDADLAVLCEKPLTVDFDEAQAAVQRIEREGRRAAVNFSLASSQGLAVLQSQFGLGSQRPLGALREIEISLEFAAWPRPWQAAAGPWLSQRAQGGFAREVLSHFIFVLQRVLGPAVVQESGVRYPNDGAGAETSLQARLLAGGVPVRISGRVDAAVPVADRNRMVWRAADGELELRDWFSVLCSEGGPAMPSLGDADALRARGQADQLDQWVELIEGRAHGLPGFGEALAVQQTIEAMLRAN